MYIYMYIYIYIIYIYVYISGFLLLQIVNVPLVTPLLMRRSSTKSHPYTAL